MLSTRRRLGPAAGSRFSGVGTGRGFLRSRHMELNTHARWRPPAESLHPLMMDSAGGLDSLPWTETFTSKFWIFTSETGMKAPAGRNGIFSTFKKETKIKTHHVTLSKKISRYDEQCKSAIW